MPHYSFTEVEDALDLPNDAIEVSPLIVGKVMMLQIAKVPAVGRDGFKQVDLILHAYVLYDTAVCIFFTCWIIPKIPQLTSFCRSIL